MKTNIKMRVTPEQSRRVQEICFENNIGWGFEGKHKYIKHLEQSLLFIDDKNITFAYYDNAYFLNNEKLEIDADLFIRTNGTCEENTFNELFEKVSERVNDFQIGNRIEPLDKYRELEQKLQKKNEILKKARIKRKNQREELHKLNLKLQKCISLEEHNEIVKTKTELLDYQSNYINQLNEQLKNYTSMKKSSQIVFDKLISASFIVFLKIFKPIRSNGSIKISERFDSKGSR